MARRDYHPISVCLHWLMFLLFAAALLFIEVRGYTAKTSSWHNMLRNWHIDAGLLVFIFAVIRVLALFGLGRPKVIGHGWQQKAASVMHGLLYLLMFLLPITGVLFFQMGGKVPALFGWQLPQFIGLHRDLYRSVKSIHEFLGNAVYYLVGLHILAALWHHFVLRDETLSRMKPCHRR